MPVAVERIARTSAAAGVLLRGSLGRPWRRLSRSCTMKENDKRNKLLISNLNSGRAPTSSFVNQKKGVDVLAKGLEKMGYVAPPPHGGRGGGFRDAALAG